MIGLLDFFGLRGLRLDPHDKLVRHQQARYPARELLLLVGVRYDATEVMQGVTEVLCYGTAVVVERA